MKVAEIFQSIDGEINHWHQGRISTFVRFAQCNLDCSYCDAPNTKQINANHKEITVEEIIEEDEKI